MPVKVRVPAPSLVKVPVPLKALAAVKLSDRLKLKAALLTTAAEPSVPVVLPEPIRKVPAVMVVVPE